MSDNDIEVRVGAKTQELQDGMARVTRVIADSMSEIRRQFDGFGAMLSGVQSMIGGIALGALGKQAVEVMSNFEQLEIRLNSVMGSVEKGQEAFAWIQQFAKDTPYQVGEVTKAFMLLKNMGIDPMGGAMKAIADRAAQTGGGFETLQRISLGLGQAWTKGKLQGEEAMQLLEAGVPVWDMLSKVLGKTTAEVQELSSKGRLGRDVIKALIDEMGRSSDGAAVAQMQSLSGMWSNLIDNIEGGLNKIRKDGALEPLKAALSEMNAEFDHLDKSGTLTQWSADIGSSIKSVGDGVMSAKQFVAEYGDQIKFLAEAYVTLKAAQAGSAVVDRLYDEMKARVAGIAAAKEKAAADFESANASSFAAKQALLLAEAESTAAQAELRRAAAQADTWQAALREAQAETDLATRTALTTQAQAELTVALDARNAATARAAAATASLNAANVEAAATSSAAAAAQVAFERATTLAGLAARGFSAVMAALGGPLGIAIMVMIAVVSHWNDIAAAAGNAAAKSKQAAEDIKQALNDVDVSKMKQGLKDATDEYNRLKLKQQTSAGDKGLSAKLDNARGIMLQYDKGLRDVKDRQSTDALASISKYKGEDPEWRKSQENAAPTASGPPKLAPEKAKKTKAKTPSHLGEWNNELDSKKLDAELSGNPLSKQQEAAFWAEKLAATKAGSKEREQVMRQHQHALLAIQKVGAQNAQELEQAQIDVTRQSKEAELAADEEAYARDAAMQDLSASQQEAALASFEQRRLAIQQEAIDARIEAMQRDPEHNIAELYKLQESKLQAEREYQRKLAAIKGQSAAEKAKPGKDNWAGAKSDLDSMYSNGLQKMLQGTLSFKQAIQSVWAEIGKIMITNMVTKPAAAWAAEQTARLARVAAGSAAEFAIKQGWLSRDLAMKLGMIQTETTATAAGETVKTGAVVAGETARTGATAAGGMARLVLKAMETIKSIMLSAWEAMAGAFAAMCAIPVVGPALGVAAGAAALGLVVGIAGNVKSASGGYSIPRGVNPMTQLHEEEMVLPKPYANVIRDMAEGKGGNGNNAVSAASGEQYHITIHAVDSHSVKRLFQDNGSALVSALRAQSRNFAGG